MTSDVDKAGLGVVPLVSDMGQSLQGVSKFGARKPPSVLVRDVLHGLGGIGCTGGR